MELHHRPPVGNGASWLLDEICNKVLDKLTGTEVSVYKAVNNRTLSAQNGGGPSGNRTRILPQTTGRLKPLDDRTVSWRGKGVNFGGFILSRGNPKSSAQPRWYS